MSRTDLTTTNRPMRSQRRRPWPLIGAAALSTAAVLAAAGCAERSVKPQHSSPANGGVPTRIPRGRALGLVVLWMIVFLIYLLSPWAAFRSVEKNIKKKRVEHAKELMDEQNVETESNLERFPAYLVEIQRACEARIRPISVSRYQISIFAVVVLLPIILTIAQIIFS